jgi:ribosomal protein S27E
MIHVKCQHCSREIRAGDEYAGKKIRCPDCKEILALPAGATATAVQPPPAVKKAAPPPPPKRPAIEEDDEDVPVAAEVEVDDEEYERRPRRSVKRRSRIRKGEWADCPHCDAPGRASRVGFTWWGGALGPWIFSHVRCKECGTCYNGRTGKSNDTVIIIYTLVSVFIGLMIGGLVLLASFLGR